MLTRPTILCVTFVLATLSTLALSTSCTQPQLNCTAAHGYFAAEYTLVEGDANSECGQLLGDVLGMNTYFQPGGMNGTPNYQDGALVIRPEALGGMIEYAEYREAIGYDEMFLDGNASGDFTDGFPDADSFCSVDSFEESHVVLPDIAEVADDPMTPDDDESLPGQPAMDITYQWRDARVLVSADAQGTQFEADLEYTQNGCTATYHVVALAPAVGCEADADCEDDKNGINPSFAVRCNTDLGLCVLDGDLPAYE